MKHSSLLKTHEVEFLVQNAIECSPRHSRGISAYSYRFRFWTASKELRVRPWQFHTDSWIMKNEHEWLIPPDEFDGENDFVWKHE